MRIITKSDISSLFLTFCHEFFMESLRVFSYDPENSCYCQKTAQNTTIHCESFSVQMFSEFWKYLWFIAWTFHIVTTGLSLPNYHIRLSLPNYHYRIITSDCHYQIVTTGLSLPNYHYRLSLPNYHYRLSLSNCHYRLSLPNLIPIVTTWLLWGRSRNWCSWFVDVDF